MSLRNFEKFKSVGHLIAEESIKKESDNFPTPTCLLAFPQLYLSVSSFSLGICVCLCLLLLPFLLCHVYRNYYLLVQKKKTST